MGKLFRNLDRGRGSGEEVSNVGGGVFKSLDGALLLIVTLSPALAGDIVAGFPAS